MEKKGECTYVEKKRKKSLRIEFVLFFNGIEEQKLSKSQRNFKVRIHYSRIQVLRKC